MLTSTRLSGAWELQRAPLPSGPRGPGDPEPAGERDGLPATVDVPGNLQIQLGFEDLWLDVPELTNLNHYEWLYTRAFASPAAGGRSFLVFAGIDYFCDVWVNGRWVGHHEGAFSEWELDVTDALNGPGEENRLTLAVSCPWRVDDRHFFLNPSTVFSVIMKNSEYMKGNLLHYWDGLPLSGNAVFPFGPWRDVDFETREDLVLERVAVSTGELQGERATVAVHLEWWNDGPARTVEVPIVVSGETFATDEARYTLTCEVGPGRSETHDTVTIDSPRLWWTWDLGEQNLYRATASVGGQETATVFGIRELRRDPETLAYFLNGQRLFLRGVWYPFANIFSAAPTAAEHRRDVEMLRDGNSNHLVSFTFVEKPAFYEACDRLGMLVFQELPYHQLGPMKVVDPSYPRFREYWDWSLGEVENIVRRLRGHASVVVWSAFAETRKNERWVWGDYTDYSAAIGEIVARVDPDTIYHPSFCDFKEEHIWNGGFPFGEFWDHYDRNHNFISEFGAIAPPVVETVMEFMPKGAAWGREESRAGRVALPIDVEEYSYRWAFDYAGLTTSVARMYRWADRSPPSLERFIDAIQWYQAFGLRYCAEIYRRKRFADIAGCRTWSYRENIPGIKFTVVDHHQRPKLGYFGLKAGYEPVLLTFDEPAPLKALVAGTELSRDLWVVNDRPTALELAVRLELFDVGGRSRWATELETHAPADDAVKHPVAVPMPDDAGAYLLRVVATDRGSGAAVASSERWVQVREPIVAQPLRLLLIGQGRYNAPILEALDGTPGVDVVVVDEETRHPQDSSWSEDIADRFDVVWYAGWDYGAHLFRDREWENVATAVGAGVGFVHTGGQGSFHGGDGRGALIDSTALEPVLPVTLRPHDGIWDQVPAIDPKSVGADVGLSLEGFPFRGFSRTTLREGARELATIGGFPLLVTGTHGGGATVAFTASLTKPLRMFRIGEGLDWEDPLDIEPHWARRDIRAYGPYWRGTRQLVLALLSLTSRRPLRGTPATLADELEQPLFEQLAELEPTTLSAAIVACDWDEERAETRGVIAVHNVGERVARLVRGSLECETSDWRFRDGFVDLLPGERANLRFEAGVRPDGVGAVAVSAQNSERLTVRPESDRTGRA
ncbi:MAG: glutamine amidotransferase [Gaiellales bacterium]